MMSLQTCPCRVLTTESEAAESSLSYAKCCQPLHTGVEVADSAERLMRSRYSAIVLALTDYIVATTLPAQQALLDKSAIEDWAISTQWAGLEIVEHIAKVGKRHAQVVFKAYFDLADDGLSIGKTQERQVHHERSTFVRVQAKWYFLDPTVTMTVTQKQPCICGSGEKFKRCCGRYV